VTSPNLALQAALVATIRGLSTAAGQRVYSVIPASPAYPYVQVWPGFETPVDEECWDRTESTMQIDVWADTAEYIKTKEIAGAIRNALHEKTMTVTGHVVDRIRVETISYSDDPPLYRARMSLSIETQPS
jgi:Protein of unknown function (DUF3168)